MVIILMGDSMSYKEIKVEDLNLDIARRISRETSKNNKQLPFNINDEGKLVVLVNDIKKEVSTLEFFYSLDVNKVETEGEYINRFIDVAFIGKKENLFEVLINKGINFNASDLHFEPREKDVLIRYRIDGRLISIFKLLKEEYSRLLSEIKVKGNMDITEKRRPQDGKINFKLKNKNYNLRLSTIPIVKGEKMVIRILYSEVFNYDLKLLELNTKAKEDFDNIINRNSGIIIINGPTGSGKSTTMYSILKEIKDDEINITTLEDPVEVQIEGINQMSLNRKADITFANGLRNILRQDPDVLMIGEIRDEETAKIAVTSSLTGHKVLTTIHTKSPEEVFVRLKDMGIKDYLIKDSINAIISQRLIRILCEKCKIKNSNEEFKAVGCLHCNNTGYKNRKVIISIIDINKIKRQNGVNIFQEINLEFRSQFLNGIKELLIKGHITMADFKKFILEEGLEDEW